MPGNIHGGSHTNRETLARLYEAEFRAQALQFEVDRLSRDLIRLREATREHLTALPEDCPRTLAKLRRLLGQWNPEGLTT